MGPKPSKHVDVKDLPSGIQVMLNQVHYTKRDIRVVGSPSEVLDTSCGDDGCREFVVFSGNYNGIRSLPRYGAFGGHRKTDEDAEVFEIPVMGALVAGQTAGAAGKSPTATLYVHPASPILGDPALLSVAFDAAQEGRVGEARAVIGEAVGSVSLTDAERAVLYAYGCLKSGPYRRAALERVKGHADIASNLVTRGFLKRSANGATQITTAGKNTRTVEPGYDRW